VDVKAGDAVRGWIRHGTRMAKPFTAGEQNARGAKWKDRIVLTQGL
jgi:hypothetical protein